uniref:Uncharacterized protein n=1 Tax=Timema monikensis TaxID=170555 RepID=A0A7R9EGG2_9NEOP|nr:unnamed protein product [Timema monikensis]
MVLFPMVVSVLTLFMYPITSYPLLQGFPQEFSPRSTLRDSFDDARKLEKFRPTPLHSAVCVLIARCLWFCKNVYYLIIYAL